MRKSRISLRTLVCSSSFLLLLSVLPALAEEDLPLFVGAGEPDPHPAPLEALKVDAQLEKLYGYDLAELETITGQRASDLIRMIGDEYAQYNYFDKAERLLKHALQMADNFNDNSYEECLFSLANLYLKKKDYSMAKEYAKQCADLSAKSLDYYQRYPKKYVDRLWQLAQIETELKDFDSAISNYQKAIDLLKSPLRVAESSDSLGSMYRNLARCYVKEGNTKLASLYFEKDISILDKLRWSSGDYLRLDSAFKEYIDLLESTKQVEKAARFKKMRNQRKSQGNEI